MKKSLPIILLFLIPFFLHSREVNYFSGTWEETMKKAKTEKKIVMLDCYTDWCSWCKVMDKSTFKSDSVIDQLDKNFIACRREMEKDPEGIKLAMKYHVQAFPSFLFFSPEGKLIHVTVGYRTTADFYAELQKIENGTGIENYPGFGPLMDPGFPDFYKKSFGTKTTKVIPKRDTIYAFLDKQKDLTSEVSWGVMIRFPLNEKYSNSVLTNATKLRELYGKDQVDQKIYSIIQARVDTAVAHNNEKELEMAIQDLDKYITSDNNFNKIYWREQFYKKNNEWEKLANMEQSIIDTCKIEAIYQSINGVCWDFYTNCNDLKICERTLPWMKKVTDAKPEYAQMDTYACLLFKTGYYKEAKEIAIKAIELGKKEGSDTSETEKLLVDIEAKLK